MYMMLIPLTKSAYTVTTQLCVNMSLFGMYNAMNKDGIIFTVTPMDIEAMSYEKSHNKINMSIFTVINTNHMDYFHFAEAVRQRILSDNSTTYNSSVACAGIWISAGAVQYG